MRKNSYQQTLSTGSTLEIIPINNPDNKLMLDITLDATLSYISHILLEEDIDEKDILYSEEAALYAMEKPFYDILSPRNPPSVKNPQTLNHTTSGPSSFDHNLLYQLSSNFGLLSASEFNKGVEEGIKFLPRMDKMVLDLEANKTSPPSIRDEEDLVEFNSNEEGKEKNESFMGCGSKGKKKSNVDLGLLEGRNRKISMSYSEEPLRNAMFDEVLLYRDNYKEVTNLKESIQNRTRKCSEKDEVEIVDIKTLLIRCAYAVSTNDCQLAEGLIKQIRKLSSPHGDGTQRMASAFVDALEARLNGTGSEVWRQIVAKRIPTSEYLKAVQLYITACPVSRIPVYYANQTILNVAKKESKLHIIDFGIGLGFQWPSLIQALSNYNDKSIKLRITGIDFPQPGFRPAELVQEIGRRLAAYAESFNVSFEYHGIVSNWEAISEDDLKIREEETLIVNTMSRFTELGDEAVSLDSPRNRVLNLIRRIRPHIFIQAIVSIGSFSPFFLSRFRQALVLYSALFEIFDTLIPRENKQRQFIERQILGRDIVNVIACEGSDWIVKPESYKQWHQRISRAGFEQIPLDPVLVKECREKMGTVHNNMFFVDEDKNWLVQGWGGRTFRAISTWQPKLA